MIFFVVGYGIDMAHLFRSLPFIGVVRQGWNPRCRTRLCYSF